jgi:hypothetical protein
MMTDDKNPPSADWLSKEFLFFATFSTNHAWHQQQILVCREKEKTKREKISSLP